MWLSPPFFRQQRSSVTLTTNSLSGALPAVTSVRLSQRLNSKQGSKERTRRSHKLHTFYVL